MKTEAVSEAGWRIRENGVSGQSLGHALYFKCPRPSGDLIPPQGYYGFFPRLVGYFPVSCVFLSSTPRGRIKLVSAPMP
jgi:hypothetical protein